MWLYISSVTRCARLAADVGWPEPAAVVISSDSLISAIALACTEATRAISCPSPLVQCMPCQGVQDQHLCGLSACSARPWDAVFSYCGVCKACARGLLHPGRRASPNPRRGRVSVSVKTVSMLYAEGDCRNPALLVMR